MVVYLTVAGCLCAGALAANMTRDSSQPGQGRAAQAAAARTAHRSNGPSGLHSAPAWGSAAQVPAAGRTSPARLNVAVSTLPASGAANEPSLAIDSTGAIFVTGPTQLTHATTVSASPLAMPVSASPLWKSTDGGATWTGPISTETGGQTATGLGGGDSDIVIGPGDSIYVTNLWLGNSSMSVSTDHGSTFTELPIGHVTPVDDRPWLTYDPASGSLYMAWDGAGALHVGRALIGGTVQVNQVPGAGPQQVPSAGPQGQLVFEQDVPAVPNEPDRGCSTCPPGTLVVDPFGNVDVAFAGTSGVGVASSTDGGLTWGTPAYVPGTAGTNASNSNVFQILRSDAQGNLYLVWTALASNGNPAVLLSFLPSGSSAWHAPIQVSTTPDALFGTLAVVAPGIVDVAYYGSTFSGDPNGAPPSTRWNLDLAQVQDLFGSPTTTTADVLPSFHHGAISTGGATGSLTGTVSGTPADRRLGDFFSIAVDAAGLANIITAADDGSGTKLQFIHETPSPPPPAAAGYSFAVPPPAATPSTNGVTQFPPVGGGSGVSAGAPTPDASMPTPPAQGTGAPADPTKATSPSGPKYAGGVSLTTTDQPGGGVPGHGPSVWFYGLGGLAATAGRFLLRRRH